MAIKNKKIKLTNTVVEVRREKVKGGKGKKRYREVPVKQQMGVETDEGTKYSDTYLSGDSKLIQDMIEELYKAKSKVQFKGIQRQFSAVHPNLTNRMIKDPVIMFAIPQWDEPADTFMEDFMKLGNGPKVSNHSAKSDRLISPYDYDREAESARKQEQRHKSPDIGSSRLWDV